MRQKKYHTITDIVATVYCEQKMVFDRERGKVTPHDIQTKAAHGRFEHVRFEVEGNTRLLRNPLRFLIHANTKKRYQRQLAAKRDARCFIATQVYGAHAAETIYLRAWRDRCLMPSLSGRLVVRVYYAVSPLIVRLMQRNQRLTKWARLGLDGCLHWLRKTP